MDRSSCILYIRNMVRHTLKILALPSQLLGSAKCLVEWEVVFTCVFVVRFQSTLGKVALVHLQRLTWLVERTKDQPTEQCSQP